MSSSKITCSLCNSNGVSHLTCPYNYNSKHPCLKSHYNVLKGGSDTLDSDKQPKDESSKIEKPAVEESAVEESCSRRILLVEESCSRRILQ